jgi:hypothetical protein
VDTSEAALHSLEAVETSTHAFEEAPPARPRSVSGTNLRLQRPRSLVECRGESHESGRADQNAAPIRTREPSR